MLGLEFRYTGRRKPSLRHDLLLIHFSLFLSLLPRLRFPALLPLPLLSLLDLSRFLRTNRPIRTPIFPLSRRQLHAFPDSPPSRPSPPPSQPWTPEEKQEEKKLTIPPYRYQGNRPSSPRASSTPPEIPRQHAPGHTKCHFCVASVWQRTSTLRGVEQRVHCLGIVGVGCRVGLLLCVEWRLASVVGSWEW